MNTVLLVRK